MAGRRPSSCSDPPGPTSRRTNGCSRCSTCGLATVEIDITFTSITMCCRRGRTVAPVTSMRLVRYRTTDLTRLEAVTLAAGVTLGQFIVRPRPAPDVAQPETRQRRGQA